MSTAVRVLGACLAVFGALMILCMIVGFFNWILIGLVVVGALYMAAKAMTSGGSKILTGDRKLQRQLRNLEKDLKTIRKR